MNIDYIKENKKNANHISHHYWMIQIVKTHWYELKLLRTAAEYLIL